MGLFYWLLGGIWCYNSGFFVMVRNSLASGNSSIGKNMGKLMKMRNFRQSSIALTLQNNNWGSCLGRNFPRPLLRSLKLSWMALEGSLYGHFTEMGAPLNHKKLWGIPIYGTHMVPCTILELKHFTAFVGYNLNQHQNQRLGAGPATNQYFSDTRGKMMIDNGIVQRSINGTIYHKRISVVSILLHLVFYDTPIWQGNQDNQGIGCGLWISQMKFSPCRLQIGWGVTRKFSAITFMKSRCIAQYCSGWW